MGALSGFPSPQSARFEPKSDRLVQYAFIHILVKRGRAAAARAGKAHILPAASPAGERIDKSAKTTFRRGRGEKKVSASSRPRARKHAACTAAGCARLTKKSLPPKTAATRRAAEAVPRRGRRLPNWAKQEQEQEARCASGR